LNEVVAPPLVELSGGGALVSHAAPESLRAWVVYRAEGDGWVLEEIVPASYEGGVLAGVGGVGDQRGGAQRGREPGGAGARAVSGL
jgi:hypothetical protein